MTLYFPDLSIIGIILPISVGVLWKDKKKLIGLCHEIKIITHVRLLA